MFIGEINYTRGERSWGAMSGELRLRFWIESFLASVTGVAALGTVFWHDWIEAILGVDPDEGNGSAEWLAVIVLITATLILGFGARLEWRRARLAQR
jgi:hypothetical protein